MSETPRVDDLRQYAKEIGIEGEVYKVPDELDLYATETDIFDEPTPQVLQLAMDQTGAVLVERWYQGEGRNRENSSQYFIVQNWSDRSTRPHHS